MGSAGTGHMGDYDLSRKIVSSGGSSKPGHSLEDETFEANDIDSINRLIRLEDVAASEYYDLTNSLPEIGQRVRIDTELHEKRMVVVDNATSMIIGNLPTRYQIVFQDALYGKPYEGTVRVSEVVPLPTVSVEING